MPLKILRYSILFLILCNIPSYLLAYFSPTLGSLSSYASSLLLIGYFVLVGEWHRPLFYFIILGILYFLLSSINYDEVDKDNFFIKTFIRFMVVVICGVEVVQRTTTKEIYFVILIGAFSIVINAFLFPTANANFYATYGRYSGFYLNPNFAGSICLIGYALSYAMKKNLKIIGQVVFTLAGILTFSRTFIVIWLLVSIISVITDRRNILVPAIGALVLVLVFALSSNLTLNTERFSALQSIFGEEEVDTKTIGKDSRTDTWANYYDLILEKPLLGNGFMKFQKRYNGHPGVHNSYLMVIGEAGILPFLLMLGIYGYLLLKSLSCFSVRPEYFYMICVLVLSLAGGHGYFIVFHSVFLSMFVAVRIRELLNNGTNTEILK